MRYYDYYTARSAVSDCHRAPTKQDKNLGKIGLSRNGKVAAHLVVLIVSSHLFHAGLKKSREGYKVSYAGFALRPRPSLKRECN